MSFFRKSGIIADTIRCDEPDYLIWKWHPAGSESGNSKRENAIRWGSSLRVKEGSVAVFVYKQENGLMQDFIEGPFDEIISGKNFPILSGLIGLGYDGNSPFQAEVYFINLAKIIQSRFVVPYFDVYDPRFQDFGVPIAVRGTMTFQIKDYREFIKLHRLDGFDHEMFDKQIKDAVTKYVKSTVANYPSKNDISVIQIEKHIEQINNMVYADVQDRLSNEFGVKVTSIDIADIDVDKTSDGYKQLKAVTQDITLATATAKAEAEIKTIHDAQRINVENYEETLRIQREEGAYAQHKQTQTANMGAFQTEKQAEVGIAGANALGKMGETGAGSVNLGDGSSAGFNPAAMMTGIALGGAVANNIAGTMQGAMNGLGQMNGAVPPPVPETVYNVAVNGQATGPYNFAALAQMAQAGQFGGQSLVWKPGMSAWAQANTVEELFEVLKCVPPVIPTEKSGQN